MAATFDDNTFAPKNRPERVEKSFKGYDYPVLKQGTYTFEVTSIKMGTETNQSFIKGNDDGQRLFVYMRILTPGADQAVTPEAQKKVLDKGHGAFFSLKMKPVVSPTRQGKEGTLNASALYKFLDIVLYQGEGIPEKDLGYEVSDAEAKAYQSEVNATAERPITLAQAKQRYPGRAVTKLLARISELAENRELQVEGTLLKKASTTTGKFYNRIGEILSKVEDEDMLPKFVAFAKPRDPREDGDNPTVVCSVTGEALRGFEWGDGTWVSNEDWAAKQKEMFGPFKYTFGGKKYSAPFGPHHYRHAKEAFQATKVANESPIDIDDDDLGLPF